MQETTCLDGRESTGDHLRAFETGINGNINIFKDKQSFSYFLTFSPLPPFSPRDPGKPSAPYKHNSKLQ